MEPPPRVDGVAYGMSYVDDLLTRLDDAFDCLEQDTVMRDALGSEFMKLFLAVKRHEINKAQAAIADYGTPEFNNRVDEWEQSAPAQPL